MSPRREQRTAACGRAEAASRLEQARKFLEVAEMLEPVDTPGRGQRRRVTRGVGGDRGR